MATVARLKTEGLLLSGELDERLPPITSGLVAHYPLDEDFNRNLVSIPSTIKVLGYFPAGRATQPWYAWFQANTTFTQTTDLSSISPATALATYDLIIADGYVWSLSGTEINYLKAFHFLISSKSQFKPQVIFFMSEFYTNSQYLSSPTAMSFRVIYILIQPKYYFFMY